MATLFPPTLLGVTRSHLGCGLLFKENGDATWVNETYFHMQFNCNECRAVNV